MRPVRIFHRPDQLADFSRAIFLPLILLFGAIPLFSLAASAPDNPAVAPQLISPARSTDLRFEVSLAKNLTVPTKGGRLLIILGAKSSPEPRFAVSRLGLDSPPILACDLHNLAPGTPAVLDQSSALFPLNQLADLRPGKYHVQAVLDVSEELKLPNGPGNFYNEPNDISLDPARGGVIKVTLDHQVPAEEVPKDTDLVKFIKLPSKLLSDFHHRPCFVRAGVILPRDFDLDPSRRYPLRVQIPGFAGRYSGVQGSMAKDSAFRKMWLAEDTPRFILVQLDGTGPYGDCYQVNSDNNGPCGDALVKELIPFVESQFRGDGRRVLYGGSTGGWVALGLQVFYPEFFSGAWVGYPDGVDFRAFELVNIYSDTNAYINQFGFERPSARTHGGDVKFTMRHECQVENVLGRGDSFTQSGGQWGAWNAVYGPRGADGRPAPLWNPRTGEIDRSVVDHWKRYDLRLVLESNWPALAPKLRGKLHIWVGDADDYFLNNAVHLLDDFLSHASPPADATFQYGPGKGHGWTPFTARGLLDQMAAALDSQK